MYKITSTAKRGGIWDEKSKKVVKEIETDNAALAEQFKNDGYKVAEIKSKNSNQKK